MPTFPVTGAARGLGREFVRQHAAGGWRVVATVRDPAAARVLVVEGAAVHPLDVLDPASIGPVARELASTPVDVLLNDAGTQGSQTFATRRREAPRFGGSDSVDCQGLSQHEGGCRRRRGRSSAHRWPDAGTRGAVLAVRRNGVAVVRSSARRGDAHVSSDRGHAAQPVERYTLPTERVRAGAARRDALRC